MLFRFYKQQTVNKCECASKEKMTLKSGINFFKAIIILVNKGVYVFFEKILGGNSSIQSLKQCKK